MEVIANLSLVNYTQKGIENVKESPQRLEAAKQALKGSGRPWPESRFLITEILLRF